MSHDPARAFATPERFRAWLERHHAHAPELLVRCYKVHAAARGVTYSQALDEALCFGWIDGVRRALDGDSFSVRFSPRRPGSVWSAVNVRRAQALERAGRMHAAGLAAFRARDPERPSGYSFESRPVALAREFQRRMDADRAARAFFAAQPPWYRRTASFWVMSAKREETRTRRFATLLDCARRGTTIPLLTRAPAKGALKGATARGAPRSSAPKRAAGKRPTPAATAGGRSRR